MPILTLTLTGGSNVIVLDSDIEVSHLKLKMYATTFPGTDYNIQQALWVDIQDGTSHWLTPASSRNGVAGAQHYGKFLLPIKNEANTRTTFAYPDIEITPSAHIPKSFTVKLYESDNTTLVTDAELGSLRLVFEYQAKE